MFKVSNRTCKATCAAGFTLVELAVVLIIVGLLASSIIGAYSLYIKKMQVAMTTDNIQDSMDSLYRYQGDSSNADESFPCPADPADPSGRAAASCSAPTGEIKVVPGVNGEQVAIGVMPSYNHDGTKTLISRDKALDGYGRRLTYAVTVSMTNGYAATDRPGIEIKDIDGTTVLSQENFLVLSHGSDGRGAYTPKGNLVKTCDTGNRDSDNCNDDASFVDNTNNRSLSTGANRTDDFIATSSLRQATVYCPENTEMRAFDMHSMTPKCVPRQLTCSDSNKAFAGFDWINNGAGGRQITARCVDMDSACPNPNEVMVRLNGMDSPPVCIKNLPGSCPPGQVQVGTNDSEDDAATYGKERCVSMVCPDGKSIVGLNEQGAPLCVAGACDLGQIQVGMDGNRNPICKTTMCSNTAGQYLRGFDSNGDPVCGDKGLVVGTCGEGEVVKGIDSNGNVQCGKVFANPDTNTLTVRSIPHQLGAQHINDILWVGARGQCMDQLMSAGAGNMGGGNISEEAAWNFCGSVFSNCALALDGDDGSNGDRVAFDQKFGNQNASCQNLFCNGWFYGYEGKGFNNQNAAARFFVTPSLTQTNGLCGPGDGAGETPGNPQCPSSGKPTVSMECMYKQ